MRISALQKFSMIDYPGKLSAVVFTQGCNFRCPYCHNPELVQPEFFASPLDTKQVIDFLRTRVGKLDAVVVTGGEPTLHGGLADFLATLKALGFLIKLDTNGTNPERLGEILKRGLADYVAMDIKAPLEKYREAVAADVNVDALRKSIALIKASGIDYEFRTTLISPVLSADDIWKMCEEVKPVKRYVLQNFVAKKVLNHNAGIMPFTSKQLSDLKAKVPEDVGEFNIR